MMSDQKYIDKLLATNEAANKLIETYRKRVEQLEGQNDDLQDAAKLRERMFLNILIGLSETFQHETFLQELVARVASSVCPDWNDPDLADAVYNLKVRIWNKQGISESRKRQLDAMEYSDYLKSDEWRWIRSTRPIQTKFCHLCRSTLLLETHHNGYPKRGEETAEDLITLCNCCHAKHHGKTPKIRMIP